MKRFIFFFFPVTLILCFSGYLSAQKYQPSWESLKQYQCPEWFKDAKFGIYFHWGPYSVPAFVNEWYTRNMYKPGTKEYKHQLATYGPLDKFGYKDFIPMFKGEYFNADKWVSLFKKAGAKFVGPVAEHADGFSMWNSTVNKWNAVNMGPHKDIVGEIAKAAHKHHLKFITTFHHQWNWAWYPTENKNVDCSNPKYAGLYGFPAPTKAFYPNSTHIMPPQAFSDLWEAKVKEVVDKYHPDMLWFDSWMTIVNEKNRKDLLAYYYNQATKRGQQAVLTYKDHDLPEGTATLDLERGRMAEKTPYVWLTDDSMSWYSWSYSENDSLKTPDRLVDELVDIVSKNGILLLDIGPKANGIIPEAVQIRLLAIGKWLHINGEAIYGTRPWKIFGEGPTEIKGGTFGDFETKNFTARDIRFTTKGDTLYAIDLGSPKDNIVRIRSLRKGSPYITTPIKSISELGSKYSCKWEQKKDALYVYPGKYKASKYAHAFRILFDK